MYSHAPKVLWSQGTKIHCLQRAPSSRPDIPKRTSRQKTPVRPSKCYYRLGQKGLTSMVFKGTDICNFAVLSHDKTSVWIFFSGWFFPFPPGFSSENSLVSLNRQKTNTRKLLAFQGGERRENTYTRQIACPWCVCVGVATALVYRFWGQNFPSKGRLETGFPGSQRESPFSLWPPIKISLEDSIPFPYGECTGVLSPMERSEGASFGGGTRGFGGLSPASGKFTWKPGVF